MRQFVGLSVEIGDQGAERILGSFEFGGGSDIMEYTRLDGGGMLVEAFMCTYNEADILPWVLRHLWDQGVHVHVIDNWSTDGTFEIAKKCMAVVERYPATGPSATYDWDALLRRVEELAEQSGADWCMLHDADEIRRGNRPGELLRDGLARIDAAGWTAMNFRVVNFKPIDDGWDGETSPEQYFRHYEERSHYDRQYHVKAWKNFRTRVDLHSRAGHEVWFPELNIASERFVIKHYPIRGQRHGEQKVLLDRIPRWNPEEHFARGWHVQYDGMSKGHNFLSDPKNLAVWED